MSVADSNASKVTKTEDSFLYPSWYCKAPFSIADDRYNFLDDLIAYESCSSGNEDDISSCEFHIPGSPAAIESESESSESSVNFDEFIISEEAIPIEKEEKTVAFADTGEGEETKEQKEEEIDENEIIFRDGIDKRIQRKIFANYEKEDLVEIETYRRPCKYNQFDALLKLKDPEDYKEYVVIKDIYQHFKKLRGQGKSTKNKHAKQKKSKKRKSPQRKHKQHEAGDVKKPSDQGDQKQKQRVKRSKKRVKPHKGQHKADSKGLVSIDYVLDLDTFRSIYKSKGFDELMKTEPSEEEQKNLADVNFLIQVDYKS
ncbi:hypothetical protein M8J76_001146 [Diaphorina citri]|nr:hypothetical protein M8J76_001146 [Diaphorina citri]